MTDAEAMARLQHELDRPPYNAWLAPQAVRAEPGEVELRLPFRPELGHHPEQPLFHGGVIAALADIAGHAVVALAFGAVAPTVNLTLDYLRPAAGEALTATARLRKLGRGSSVADVELTAGGRLVALARGSFSTRAV